ncbi:mannose-1-phosphate guanylyltransferase [Oerskovia turbata]|uniref:Mannose-1-phosphate guanylyltransferase n=1 Tax=Oerskovia turbata TaxID=1713 RepID=A0A4Q1L393_9CELL|nr:mannose-1-phosphate guanylyltransferase [Oerskovia turbata]RXR26292.1 mannose-1-phosphate guanylyltransferase [Oerskovia turbata]RXR36794.1 mannose-1-phosphate guanylyltransferase [Oerskovia turbata]TGJ97481.1 mannose-1-phosphate guanylyltransferase [Actinotalea fermentans ATCC 43279 = JCM 9966 = DSM 3133]
MSTLPVPAPSPDSSPDGSAPATPVIPGFYAVIPAGGAGTRLWPLSRRGNPKFLLDLTGAGRSLLQATVDRLAPLAGQDGIVLVTGRQHVASARTQLPGLRDDAVLAEPSPRDSMAAIGLAAAVLEHRHGDVVIGSFAADQVITGQAAFEQAVREGVEAARAGHVVTVGIAASRPSTAFGYVRSGASLDLAGAPTALHAQGFTEKPDAVTAQRYVRSGEYRWNAGMFITRTSVLLGHLADQRPELHDGLRTVAAAWDTPDRDRVLAEVWPGLEKIAIDHAVAEPVAAVGGVAVVPGNFGWDDIGDFNSLAVLLPSADESGSKVLGDTDRVVRRESAGSVVVPASDRVVTILGLDDVVVVDTPDALLVTTRARAQQVKAMVDLVRERGLDELL